MHLKAMYESSEAFKKDLCGCESISGFYYKLVAILSLICRDGKRYCFCEKYESSLNSVCPIVIYRCIFITFEKICV